MQVRVIDESDDEEPAMNRQQLRRFDGDNVPSLIFS
jgi:hypothetical protein